MRNGQYGEGSGSILLDDLVCTGSEDSLLDCIDISEIGSHDCDHSEDAGVRCEGMFYNFMYCACACVYCTCIFIIHPATQHSTMANLNAKIH